MKLQKALSSRKTQLAVQLAFLCCAISACTSNEKTNDQSNTPHASSLATPIKRGLTEEEAVLRAKQVTDISYDLQLNVASSRTHFSGQANIKFRLIDRKLSETLRIDFSGGTVFELQVNGLSLQPKYNGQFIEIPVTAIKGGREAEQNILVKFEHKYNQDGRGLSTFLDPVDKKTYLSSQFEAFDANQVFPCFDQPDLKAVFLLVVDAPADWQVVTATRESRIENVSETTKRWTFPKSSKFSTYVMSVHAGPYKMWKEKKPFRVPLRLFARQSIAADVKPEEWFPITRFGFDFFENYFGVKYPYLKYDQLIVPEFNAGAMENVAAVTFTERFVSRGPKTKRQMRGLSSTILHEMAHMWFGNLVTMRWWGDLWLNESFATYMATVALSKHPDNTETWRAFAASKFFTYQEDQMPTTHPVVARVVDTEDALTAFDGISYGKGAAVLHQMIYKLGEPKFKQGLRNYFHKFRETNTTYQDFLASVGASAEVDLGEWSEAWLKTAGLNQLEMKIDCKSPGTVLVEQSSVSGTQIPRPHVTEVSLLNRDLKIIKTLTATLPAKQNFSFSAQLTEPEALACPLIVFPNSGDYGYFKISYTESDIERIISALHKVQSPMLRQQLLAIGWDHVRDAKLKYMSFTGPIERLLENETDEIIIHQGMRIAAEIQNFIWNSVPNSATDTHRDRLDKVIWQRLKAAKRGSTERAAWTQSLILLSSPWGISKIKETLDKPDPSIDQDRRWDLILRLSQLGDPETQTRIAAEVLRDSSSRGVERRFSAEAAFPKWEAKIEWLERFKKSNSSLSFSQKRAALTQLFPPSQMNLRRRFAEEFYDHLTWANKNREGMEAALITALAPFDCQVDSEPVLKSILQSSEASELQPMIKKNLTQIVDEADRCRKINRLQMFGSMNNLP